MKAITKSGIAYDVKFWNNRRLMELFHLEHDDDAIVKWFHFGALINISGEWYHCHPEDDLYRLSGRYSGSDQVHGRQGKELLYLYENTFYPADPVQECQYVSAVSAYHR